MKDIKDRYQEYLRSPTMEMLADNAWYLPMAAPSQNPAFFRFSQLPFEIRRMIWRASLDPRRFLMTPEGICTDSNGVTRCGWAALPATAGVNYESRQEVHLNYSMIPQLPPAHPASSRPELQNDNNGLINYEIDILRFKCCPPQSLGAWQYPATLLQRLKRMEVAITCNRMVSYGLCRVGRKCLHSFDSFLDLVVSAYFPNLRELHVEVKSSQVHPRTRRLAHLREFGWDVDHIMRVPYFLHMTGANGGGGVLISSSASEDQRRHHVAMIKINFMDEKDATLYAIASDGNGSGDDGKKEINPLDHRNFLNGLAACLWHVFSIQTFLWRDGAVREILEQGNCRC